MRIRIHVGRMDLTRFCGAFVALKLTEISIFDVLMRFGPILVAKKWYNTKWCQLVPNLGPWHALPHESL